jgi:putative SOS response-associated peptidase YedK
MCNLYNITTSQEAIRQWTRALRDILGNLEPSIDIYPNQFGPVVRNASDGERELANLRWGMPTQYGHWQQYVGVEHRCVVPVTSFAEPSPTPNDKDPETGGIQRNFWFALNEDRPLFFFAGLWTRWQGVRKVKEGPGDHEVYGFMTTKPNALIAPIQETETWLTKPWSEAKRLQRTAPDNALVIVDKPATQIKNPQQAPAQGSLL